VPTRPSKAIGVDSDAAAESGAAIATATEEVVAEPTETDATQIEAPDEEPAPKSRRSKAKAESAEDAADTEQTMEAEAATTPDDAAPTSGEDA
jgi:hypothetical protein